MDEYTASTREWLDRRYRRHASGDYEPHQPVHGVEAARTAGVLRDYVRIFRILRALSRLSFSSLLDVGAAEGFVAVLARRLLGAHVEVTDLSGEACARASELFGLTAHQADVHTLPFADGAFDVVGCSETLEHVTDFDAAIGELLRVARTAVVVTVPHESAEDVHAEREGGVPHGHIHAFDTSSFAVWKADDRQVFTLPILSRWGRHPFALLEARALSTAGRGRIGRAAGKVYERARPVLRRVPARSLVAGLVGVDEAWCTALPGYDGVLAVIVKRPEAWLGAPRVQIRPADVIDARAASE